MRIVQIHYTGFGGLSSVVETMVRAPGAEAHDWVMGYYGVQPLDPSHKAFCNDFGIDYGIFRSSPGNPWAAWLSMITWLEKKRPDAIICHSITALLPCAWHARLRNVPIIAVEHMAPSLKSRNEWMGSRAAMLFAHCVVIQDHVFANEISEKLGFFYQSNKVHIIPNGINTALFSPSPERVHGKKALRIGMASRFSIHKRQDILIAMFELVALRFPQANLVLPGDGSQLDVVRTRASSSLYADRIQIDGPIPQSSVPEWLRGIDIYLHATNGETLSMSILQAMATGLPIIASDVPGVRELIDSNGRLGLRLPNEPDAWANAVSMLATNCERSLGMGASARDVAVKRFGSAAMLASYISVIEELLQ